MEHPYSQGTTSDVSRKCGTSMKMPNLPTYKESTSNDTTAVEQFHCSHLRRRRTTESAREWKDQKFYTAMEIRHLVVPSLSSSLSLAETRAATLEGEKCGHPEGIVFVSFDIRDINVP